MTDNDPFIVELRAIIDKMAEEAEGRRQVRIKGWVAQPHFEQAKGKTVEEIRAMMLASHPQPQ